MNEPLVPDTTIADDQPDPADLSDPSAGPASDVPTGPADPDESPPILYLPSDRGLLRRTAPVLLGIVVVLVVGLGLGGWWVTRQINPPGAPGPAVIVTIPDGSSDSQIANVLAAHRVVTNATVFQYYVKANSAGPFKAGVYDGLHAPEAMSDVVKRLNKGPLPPATRKVVIPEGLWLSETRARILQTFPEMKPADLDHALATVHSKYQPKGSTNLEGFLFPATYEVLLTDVANPTKLVQQMVTTFDEEADSVGLGQSQARVGLTPYQTLTLASMIEEEAKLPGDRPKVARVIFNRLAKPMTLGIDATVEYALQQRVQSLTNSQLAVNSPYNTRTHQGLPPTPISSPGRASLEAALNPAAGDWLYFVVTDKDGGEFFTSNERDFERAAAKARAEGLFGG